jgi:DNA-binding MarR family transcriptional regulator
VARDEDAGPQLSQRLSYLLKRAFLSLEELHREHLEPLGLGSRELSVLMLVDAREPESQLETAARLRVDRTTMVTLLDGLEAKGLVARHPDPGDRRRNVVALTDAGRRALAKGVEASDEAEAQLLGALDASERTQLRALLARLDTEDPDDA